MAKKYSAKSKAKREPQGSMRKKKKMQLLFTVVNRNKTEFYMDLLGNFDVNLQMVFIAHGTEGE